jgi:hypothetical protein
VWVIAFPILPGAFDTTVDGYEITDLLAGEPVVTIL